jgi:cell wall-associated NlpC family hydrolase
MACVVTACVSGPVQAQDDTLGGEIAQAAINLLNAPYVPGGIDIQGFDCSGLSWYIHQQNGVDVPRKAEDQSRTARPVLLPDLAPGDLIFFHMKGSSADRGVDHVGIYIGNGFFIHVSTSARIVAYARLDNVYFRDRIVSAGRFWSSPLRAAR